MLSGLGGGYCNMCASYNCIHTLSQFGAQQQMSKHYYDAIRGMAIGTVAISSGSIATPEVELDETTKTEKSKKLLLLRKAI